METSQSAPRFDAGASNRPSEPLTVSAVATLTGVLAVGSVLMAIAHAGVRVPLLSAIGPDGDDIILPAAVAFSVTAIAAAFVAAGTVKRRAWAWATGLVVHAVVLTGSLVPFRGAGSVAGATIAGVCIALLVSPPARRALLPPRAA